MLMTAVEAEVAAYIEAQQHEVDERGRNDAAFALAASGVLESEGVFLIGPIEGDEGTKTGFGNNLRMAIRPPIEDA